MAEKKISKLAVWSAAFGALSILLIILIFLYPEIFLVLPTLFDSPTFDLLSISALVAMILGIIALMKIGNSDLSGRPYAIFGMIPFITMLIFFTLLGWPFDTSVERFDTCYASGGVACEHDLVRNNEVLTLLFSNQNFTISNVNASIPKECSSLEFAKIPDNLKPKPKCSSDACYENYYRGYLSATSEELDKINGFSYILHINESELYLLKSTCNIQNKTFYGEFALVYITDNSSLDNHTLLIDVKDNVK